MKRIGIIALIALIASGALFAQTGERGHAMGPGNPPKGEIVKIEGKLALINGLIAVQTKDKTYYVHGFEYLIGFVDGLKEGATVKVEGEAMAVPLAPEYQTLKATKLSFNGRDIDLVQGRGFGAMGQGGPCSDGQDRHDGDERRDRDR